MNHEILSELFSKKILGANGKTLQVFQPGAIFPFEVFLLCKPVVINSFSLRETCYRVRICIFRMLLRDVAQ